MAKQTFFTQFEIRLIQDALNKRIEQVSKRGGLGLEEHLNVEDKLFCWTNAGLKRAVLTGIIKEYILEPFQDRINHFFRLPNADMVRLSDGDREELNELNCRLVLANKVFKKDDRRQLLSDYLNAHERLVRSGLDIIYYSDSHNGIYSVALPVDDTNFVKLKFSSDKGREREFNITKAYRGGYKHVGTRKEVLQEIVEYEHSNELSSLQKFVKEVLKKSLEKELITH